MGCLRGLDSIPGRMAAFTVETSSRASETGMECGMMRTKVVNAIRGTICWIKSTALAYMTGRMGTCIKAISSKINDAERGSSTITIASCMMDFG